MKAEIRVEQFDEAAKSFHEASTCRRCKAGAHCPVYQMQREELKRTFEIAGVTILPIPVPCSEFGATSMP